MKTKNKLLKNLYTNSLILSLPGFFSIFLSLFAIPIHLKGLGIDNYGNYLIFHIFLSLSFLLNLGISKTIVISSNRYRDLTKGIAYDGIKFTIIILIIIALIYLFCNYFYLVDLSKYIISNKLFFLGLIISILYLTLEGIMQAYKLFKHLSIFNFFFYSFSLSLPSISILVFKEINLISLISFSVLIKLFLIVFLIIFLISRGLIKKDNKGKFYKSFLKNSPWLTLNSLFVQLYEMLDKYLIKIFLGSSFMAVYSIPQQLTGKLSILSKGFSAFLLPNISHKKKNLEFFYSIDIFLKYIPLIIFLIFPFYPYLLKFWLGNEYSILVHDLTKIFSLIAIFSCVSHILLTKFEADQLSYVNFRIEVMFLPLFLIALVYMAYANYSLINISLLVLIKEIVLIFFRICFLKINYKRVQIYFFYLASLIILLFLSFINFKLFYLITIILLLFTFKNVKFNY